MGLRELAQDVGYAIRLFMKSPSFTAIVVLTLALGIGANTAIFSLVNAILLEPLQFPQPDRLVALYEYRAEFKYGSISYPNFEDWRRENRSFEGIAGFREDDFTLTGLGQPERINGIMISAGFFPILGVRPLLGSGLDAQEDHSGGKPEALISESFWKEKFGGAANVIGKPLELDGTSYTIAGVVPASFQLDMQNIHTRRVDVYTPVGQWNDALFRMRNVGMGMDAIARLKPGITLAQARADLAGVSEELAKTYPGDDTDVRANVVPLREKIVGEIRPYLLVLSAAVFFVLLIACVNVANLLLARSMQRSREFAIRTALGASRTRVIRQLLTESVLLSLCGGALGLLVAGWGTQAAVRFLPDILPRAEQVRMDPAVLIFTLVVSVLCGIFFGLAPALKARGANLQDTMKEGARGSTGAHSRVQSAFVASETAIALLLLVGAGLMIRTLAHLWSVNPGFQPKHLLCFQVSLAPSMNGAPAEAVRADFRRLHDEIASVPGVVAVSLQHGGLPMWSDSEDPFWIEGQPKPARESEMPWANWYEVQPDYLKVMGIPLKRGRFFTVQDNESSPFVTVIDTTFAAKYFPGEDPIGKSINDEFLGRPAEIVGIVGNVKQWGLDDRINLHAEFYIPVMQLPDSLVTRETMHSAGVLVRTQGPPLAMVEPIRKKIQEANNQDVLFEPRSYEEVVSNSLSERSLSMILLGSFAALALVLASIGIYGVVSYVVGQRTREIGIRMALGAQRQDVLRLVLGEGAKMALVGVGVGLVGALALTRLMDSILYGVSARDPLTFAAVAILLSGVALLACFLPAWRAMRIDPMVALRYE